jgi:MFS family permease
MLHALAFHGIYSLLVNLYLLRLGYGPSLIGLFNGIASIAIALSPLTAALLSRRWGLKIPLMFGLVCSTVLIAILPVAELLNRPAQTVWLLAINTLIAFAVSIWFVFGIPFMMSLVEAGERSRTFSIRWALLALGGFTGNLAGGWLPPLFAFLTDSSVHTPEPFRYALWLASALIAIAAIGMKRTHPGESPEHGLSAEETENNGGLARLMILFLIVALLLQAATNSTKMFFNVYMETTLGADTVGIGYVIGAGWLIAIPASLSMPLLSRRFGHGRTSATSSVVCALALISVAMVPSIGMTTISFLIMNLMLGAFWPSFQVYSMSMVKPNRRPMIYGVIVCAGGLAGILLGAGGGPLIATTGFREFFLISSALTLLGAAVFWLTLLRRAQIR